MSSTKKINELQINLITGVIHIVGTSPLIVHAWSRKASQAMYDNQTKAAKAPKKEKNPQEDYENASYKLPDGRHGFPVEGLKRSMKNSSMMVSIKEASKVGQACYLCGVRTMRPVIHDGAASSLHLIPLVCSKPVMREDMVKVGGQSKTADFRYRPEYEFWAMRIVYKLNPSIMSEDEMAGYLAQAGHGVGIGEWRPQKNGVNGTFRLATAEEAELIDSDPDAFIENMRKLEIEDNAAVYPDNRRIAA